ncbi:hypothetical protein RFI_32346, partial [Reticulomyxa filosa]
VVETTKAAINSCNFREAEEKIKLVRRITRILGHRFQQISLDNSNEEKMKEQSGKIVNSVDELEKQLESVLKNVVNKYKEIKLSGCQFNPYASNPPKALYDKLDKVMQIAATSNYREAWEEIEGDITKKVRDLLLDAREKVTNSNSRESEACIRLCESVLNSLPEHVQEILKDEIQQCREDIKYEIENALKEVEQVMQKKNVQDINELLSRCNSNQEKTIKSGVDKMAREIVSRIDKQWMDGETSEALSSMEELYRFKNTFKKKMPDLDRYFINARDSLSSSFDKYQKHIITTFESVDRGTTGLEWTEKAFDFVLICLEVKTNPTGDIDPDELLPLNFNEKIKELDSKTYNYFVSLQQRFKKSMEAMNVEELHAVLNVMKTVGNEGPFLQKVRAFMKKKTVCGISDDSTFKLFTYSEMIRDLNSYLEKMVDEVIGDGIINATTKANDVDRERFFNQVKDKLNFLKQISQLKGHVTNTQKLESCETVLEKEVQDLAKKNAEISKWNSTSCSEINLYYKCFTVMQKNGILLNVMKPQIDAIEDMVKNRVEQIEKDAITDLGVEHVLPRLLSMKEISVHIFDFKAMVDKRIDELLSAYKRHNSKNGMSISLLALQLEKDPSGIGYNVALFNVKTQSHGIDHVLKKVETKGVKIDEAKLEKKYEDFNTIYRKLIQDNLAEKPTLSMLVSNIKMITRGIEQKPDNVDWSATIRNKIPDLMAHIFALWTLQNAQFYFDAKGADNQDSYLLQPHAAQ